MVQLISQPVINSLNIDTVERAIIFATLALQKAIATASNNFLLRQKVKLKLKSDRDNNIQAVIDVILPFDFSLFSKYGGNLLRGIIPFDLGDVTILRSDFTFSNVNPTIPITYTLPINSAIVNFEQYLFFYTAILFD